MRTAVRLSRGKQRGGYDEAETKGREGQRETRGEGEEEEKPPWEGEEEDIPPWEGEEKEAQRERGAHRARGLRLTGAVGRWWERADPNSRRTFDSHLEWRTQGNIRH